jgi:hypothetical protein
MQKSPMQPATAPILVRLNDQSMLRSRAFNNIPILVHRRVFGLIARMPWRNASRHKFGFRSLLENGRVSDNCQYDQSKRVQYWKNGSAVHVVSQSD